MGILDGKVAIITGAARGQGAAEVHLFLTEGCRVVASDRDEAALFAQHDRDNLAMLQHDVSSAQDWSRVVESALARFGRIDILINNAAVFVPSALQATDFGNFDLHYRVNQVGVFLGMKAVLEPMTASGGGSIVNISSTAGVRGSAGAFAYATSKWAIRGMSKSAARDLSGTGIRVNAILPGLIDTAMMRQNPAERNSALLATIPMGRPGTAAEVASAALYLASDASSYVTGSEIIIDGGQNG